MLCEPTKTTRSPRFLWHDAVIATPNGENMEIETRVSGIPCIARVTHYFCEAPHRGSAHTCNSDVDYRGYTECEFDILDRRGRPAFWLERKASDEDRQRIEQEITEQLEI
jgi:hypothetical protein